MFVIKLPNGNLMAPESAIDADGEVVGDAYVEVFPTDPEYARLVQQAVTEQELEDRQRRWRDGDEGLRRGVEGDLAKEGSPRQERAGRGRPGPRGRTGPPMTGQASCPALPAARRGAGHGPRTRGTSCGLRAS